MFFEFPPDAHWNADRACVTFGIGIGEYQGVVRVHRRVFQSLLGSAPTAQRCLEAYHLRRTRLEMIAERKVRRRQLTDDGNVEIIGRDLRDRDFRPPERRIDFIRLASYFPAHKSGFFVRGSAAHGKQEPPAVGRRFGWRSGSGRGQRAGGLGLGLANA